MLCGVGTAKYGSEVENATCMSSPKNRDFGLFGQKNYNLDGPK
jgi:hypothetical protein